MASGNGTSGAAAEVKEDEVGPGVSLQHHGYLVSCMDSECRSGGSLHSDPGLRGLVPDELLVRRVRWSVGSRREFLDLQGVGLGDESRVPRGVGPGAELSDLQGVGLEGDWGAGSGDECADLQGVEPD